MTAILAEPEGAYLHSLSILTEKIIIREVVVPKGSLLIPEINKLGIKTIETDGIAEKSLSLEGIKKLKKIIKQSDCDIVHTHGN